MKKNHNEDYTINNGTTNSGRECVEIHFEKKPGAEIREALKASRFWWNGKRIAWCGFTTEEAARELLAGVGSVSSASEPKTQSAAKPEPSNAIRFYWNGLKLDGGALVKCYYSKNEDGTISIYADSYSGDLPRRFFEVKNDTDIYTDYFEKDSATVTSSHPLYKFVLHAANLATIHAARLTISTCEKRIAAGRDRYGYDAKHIETARAIIAKTEAEDTDPGQPTAADVAAVDQANTERENAKREAERLEELRERENFLALQCEARRVIREESEAHPVKDGEPVVVLEWSECPGIEDNTRLSSTAAENVLRALDEYQHATRDTARGCGWYWKTSFAIESGDTDENGEPVTYTGRYDIGDNDGGLVAHIRAIGEYSLRHDAFGHEKTATETRNAYIDMADWLAGYVETVAAD